MTGGRFLVGLIAGAGIAFSMASTVFAAQEAGGRQWDLEQFDVETVDEYLGQNQPEGMELSFQDLVVHIGKGEFKEAAKKIGTAVKDALVSRVGAGSRLLGQVVLLGLFGALFSGFSGIFSNGQISETGFFVTYLMLFTCLSAGFFQSIQIAEKVFRHLLDFMRALLPSFFLSVAFCGGSVAGAALYETTLGMVAVFQWICLFGILPMIKIYAMLILAGKITKEDSLSKLTKLTESAVRWGLKTMAGLLLGFQLIQGMVLPSVDALGKGSLFRLLEAVPGVGQGARTVTQTVLGAGVLIKNSIGTAAVAVLAAIAALPLIQLMVLAVLYQICAALLEPVCDKRIVSCIHGISLAHQLLIRLVWTSLVLFAVTLAILCAFTNVMYFAG
ncbi:MAG: stage III sporulation protein AE [Lachnospiraceae bacterium]